MRRHVELDARNVHAGSTGHLGIRGRRLAGGVLQIPDDERDERSQFDGGHRNGLVDGCRPTHDPDASSNGAGACGSKGEKLSERNLSWTLPMISVLLVNASKLVSLTVRTRKLL